MKFKYGITHRGRPHLDEIMAAAVIEYLLGEFPIKRKEEITKKEYDDPEILVFDIGKRYSPETNCFDHHQNKRLPSACYLIWEHFAPTLTYEERVVKSVVLKNLLKPISNFDVGKYDETSGLHANTLFNYMSHCYSDSDISFTKGVEFCDTVLRGLINKTLDKVTLDAQYEEQAIYFGPNQSIVRFKKHQGKLPDEWKKLARSHGVDFIVTTHIRTLHSELHSLQGITIPEDKKTQIEHSSDVVIFKNETLAINSALDLILRHKKPPH